MYVLDGAESQEVLHNNNQRQVDSPVSCELCGRAFVVSLFTS